MPLPASQSPLHLPFPNLLVLCLLCAGGATLCAQQQSRTNARLDRALRHSDVQWIAVAPHLPDPATATPADLENAADVLRARRLPEDALEYYGYALARGGDPGRLAVKLGVVDLELQQVTLARAQFRHAVKLAPKNADAWNDLAATEYLQRDSSHAISDYKHALKLNYRVASFHSNLGTALFEQKNYKKAVEEYTIALQLDPEVFEKHSGAGVTAHMLSPDDHGRFCYEMAKLALARGDEAEMLHWLAKAAESEFDLRSAMGGDKAMAKYRDDPRVLVLTQSAKALRTQQVVSLGSIPDIKPDAQKKP